MMYSIAFPNMVGNSSTNLVQDKAATLSNTKLLLMSMKMSLFGDPDFGTNLLRLMFEQNNIVLRDLVVDDIYTAIAVYIPQIVVNRKDIVVVSDGTDIFVSFKGTNQLDFTVDTYTINLTKDEE